MSKKVEIYSTNRCPYCVMAKQLLTKLGMSYQEINIETDQKLAAEMMQRSGRRTVPQIFIDDVSIGGYDDLRAKFSG